MEEKESLENGKMGNNEIEWQNKLRNAAGDDDVEMTQGFGSSNNEWIKEEIKGLKFRLIGNFDKFFLIFPSNRQFRQFF